MYFSEQFSPLAENMMTGGKEKLKLGLRIYTIQVRSLPETLQRGNLFTIPFGSNGQTLWNAVWRI